MFQQPAARETTIDFVTRMLKKTLGDDFLRAEIFFDERVGLGLRFVFNEAARTQLFVQYYKERPRELHASGGRENFVEYSLDSAVKILADYRITHCGRHPIDSALTFDYRQAQAATSALTGYQQQSAHDDITTVNHRSYRATRAGGLLSSPPTSRSPSPPALPPIFVALPITEERGGRNQSVARYVQANLNTQNYQITHIDAGHEPNRESLSDLRFGFANTHEAQSFLRFVNNNCLQGSPSGLASVDYGNNKQVVLTNSQAGLLFDRLQLPLYGRTQQKPIMLAFEESMQRAEQSNTSRCCC